MEVIIGSKNAVGPVRYAVVTIGNFDGVHLGHQGIFRQAVRMAREQGGVAMVLTFEPHPVTVLSPKKQPHILTPFSKKMRYIEACGIDRVVCEEFNRQLVEMSARDFAAVVLADRLQARQVVVGSGFSFGQGRKGTAATLEEMGRKLGFGVCLVEPIAMQGSVVSSSRIRRLLDAGNVEAAADLLGRPHAISGPVVEGRQRGNTLGFPTANLEPGEQVIPSQGVYAVLAETGGATYRGVVNIGRRPTFGREPLSVEAHLLDFNQRIYGKELEIAFIRRIRGEIAFASAEALASQILQDVQTAKSILAGSEF
jgi:riboflavin kinase/FMN adenylyltransferase